MPTYELTLTLRQNGLDRPGFPIFRRMELPITTDLTFSLTPAGDTATWVGLTYFTTTANFFMGTYSEPITWRFGGDSDLDTQPVVSMGSGGLVIFIDAALPGNRVQSNVRANNNSGVIGSGEYMIGVQD
jgi:hypothetical protein